LGKTDALHQFGRAKPPLERSWYRLFISNTSENLIFQMQGGAAHFRIARISQALRRNIVFCDALRRLAHNG
jgi:hypothetical protein